MEVFPLVLSGVPRSDDDLNYVLGARKMNLHEALESVFDAESFLAFARQLAEDRAGEVRRETDSSSSPYGPGANGWENGTIEAFLEAAVSWGEESARQNISRADLMETGRCLGRFDRSRCLA
jgi:hypothetical protein